ncbi:hypothetical protein [Salibacterium lacus]|uniref:Uncharacterized protein n=1 Tax=Salibacterium lacus TaxID=1898109 RepID=A0ABW5T4N1_9BACI
MSLRQNFYKIEKYRTISKNRSVFFVAETSRYAKMLCFPRARLKPPRKKTASCGVLRLVLFPQESKHFGSAAIQLLISDPENSCYLPHHVLLSQTHFLADAPNPKS